MDHTQVIFIPVVLAAITVFLICLKSSAEKRKKLHSLVRETSVRYHALTKLNRMYSFSSVKPLHSYKSASSKQQYDHYNLNTLFMETLASKRSIIENEMLKAETNSILYDDYCHAFNELPPYTNQAETDAMNVPLQKYSSYEKEICHSLKLCPSTAFSITCHISYTSPQGRNSYHREQHYGTLQIQHGYTELEIQKRYEHSKEYQRSIMTQKLRYSILQRDGFRCVLCGRSTADGVKLEVDHICPVSKGGLTTPENLRTLCLDCNRGKSSTYHQNGIN